MKKFIILFYSILLVFGLVGMVGAITYTDYYSQNVRLSGFGDSIEWVFNITKDGFNPVSQDVTSASITLHLADDSNCDFWEFANLNIGNNNFFWEVDTGSTSFSVSSLISLSETGKVAARLTSIVGDFWFKRADLHAEGTGSNVVSTPVPEPGTMLTLGFVLLGLVAVSRKRLKERN